ncbi:MAG: thioesterase family protein, partial [Actinophytocola sp.]|nr:thioesterase family protein [Actinophytocola sp.]
MSDQAAEAFYVPGTEGVFLSTPHTAGPWTTEAQHLGPPSALLVRALEQVDAERESQLARVTIEILGPVPLDELTVRAGLVRPGRSV